MYVCMYVTYDDYVAHLTCCAYSFSSLPSLPHQTTTELECSVLTPTSLYDGRLDQLQRLGIAPLAWGALGGDPLAGANRLFNFPDAPRQKRILAALEKVAAEIGPGKSMVEYHHQSSLSFPPEQEQEQSIPLNGC